MPEKTQDSFWPSASLLGEIERVYPKLCKAIREKGIRQMLHAIDTEGSGMMDADDVLMRLDNKEFELLRIEAAIALERKALREKIEEELDKYLMS